jgi:cytochrome c
MRLWLSLALATILSVSSRDAAAQTGKSAAVSRPRPVTTRSGVYSAQQAARGKDIYSAFCKSCHTAVSHTSETFHGLWSGKRLSELFGFIRERMPKNEPASLSDEEYVDVLAYVLKLNNMPSGAKELPPDTMALAGIRIELTKLSARKDR